MNESIQEKTHSVNSSINFEYSGFWRRFIAFLIDKIILLIPLFFIMLIILYLSTTPENLSDNNYTEKLIIYYLFSYLIIIILNWLYFSFMESSKYQASLGKLIMGIKVVDIHGKRLSFEKASNRFFATTISYLTFYVGFLMVGFTQNKQTLHDILTNCLIIKNKSTLKNNEKNL